MIVSFFQTFIDLNNLILSHSRHWGADGKSYQLWYLNGSKSTTSGRLEVAVGPLSGPKACQALENAAGVVLLGAREPFRAYLSFNPIVAEPFLVLGFSCAFLLKKNPTSKK